MSLKHQQQDEPCRSIMLKTVDGLNNLLHFIRSMNPPQLSNESRAEESLIR